MSGDVSRIKIEFALEGLGNVPGELVRFLSPRTAEALLRAMPMHGRAATWKEEVYFETSLKMGLEKSKSTVESGTIAYWPMGSALCIFFGKTPVSKGDEIRPASAVNIIGKVVGDCRLLKRVKDGEEITIRRY